MKPIDDKVPHRVRSVRLPDDEIGAILDDLDRGERDLYATEAPVRYHYRVPALHLDIWPPNASVFVPHSVPTRWLSATSLGCLHGCFVHPSTLCQVVLMTAHGAWDELAATVRSCRHITKRAHSVELRFARRIDPALYCAAATTCHILLVEDDELTARMISAWLAQLNTSVELVGDGMAAVDSATKAHFDLILLDLDLPVLDGFQVARHVRSQGYAGWIIAMSSLATPPVEHHSLESGCDRFLAKPFGRAQLAELIESLHEEPVLSLFHGDQSYAPLIADFALALPSLVQAIRESTVNGDLGSVAQLIRKLRSRSGIYGFDAIAASAEQVQAAMTGGARAEDAARRVEALLKLCARVRSPAAPPPFPSAVPPSADAPAPGAN